jgi:hypothetical protein
MSSIRENHSRIQRDTSERLRLSTSRILFKECVRVCLLVAHKLPSRLCRIRLVSVGSVSILEEFKEDVLTGLNS